MLQVKSQSGIASILSLFPPTQLATFSDSLLVRLMHEKMMMMVMMTMMIIVRQVVGGHFNALAMIR